MSLLEVEGLNTYYEDSHILFDVSLKVERHVEEDVGILVIGVQALDLEQAHAARTPPR